MTKLSTVLVLLAPLLFGACASVPKTTKARQFPLMYEEKPHVIAVLPPINSTTAADAKEYYSTTVAQPLAMSGYYVIPIEVTTDILKRQGLYDTEMLAGQPLNRFYDYFGADAVLIPRIVKWDTTYAVLASNLTVSVEADLKSTHTNRVLWSYSGTVVLDLSRTGGSSGNLLADLVVKAVATAINTAMADYVPVAQQANFVMLSSIPRGKYAARYLQDQDDPVFQGRGPVVAR